MRAPWKRDRSAAHPPRDRPVADPRVWGRNYRGPRPWIFGGLVALLLAACLYLAFAKQLPWSSDGYTLTATFENAATLRETAPVRIAGVTVGEVKSVDGTGDGAEVTFTVEEDGQPIHSDAEVEIRPRLFLEGNFFLDLQPGSPSADELMPETRSRSRRRRPRSSSTRSLPCSKSPSGAACSACSRVTARP